jgi:signal transduction histidine kinase
VTASTTNQSSEQLSRVRRGLRFAVLPMLLLVAGLVVLAMVEDALDKQRERLSQRISEERQSIEPPTSIRRDARKTYVALLERWLAPPQNWPNLEKKIQVQAGALLRSSQGFVEGIGVTAAERQHRTALATALTTWAAFIDRMRGTAAGAEVRNEARDLIARIDRECSAILTANLDGASQDDAAREVVHQRSTRIHVTVVSLRVLFAAFVIMWYLRMKSTRKLAKALGQKRLKEEQNLILERLVRERTAELEKNHAWLAESAAQLFVAKEELEKRVHELATAKNQLVQAEKLQAVGQLAAGIAHEINTPAQFVGDGLHFLKEAYFSYKRLVGHYRSAVEALALEATGAGQVLVGELRRIEEDVDLPYLDAEVPASFVSCMEGIFRITTIVESMKEFAKPDQREKSPADLNHALQATLVVARSEYGSVAEVTTEFGDLPPVPCHVGDLNQVFLNLIVNAAHAVGDVVEKRGGVGTIRIRTSREDNLARIDIADSGCGIPEAIRHRVFDPFFTTMEVGKGTGQGLAIARSVVVTKHGGTLTFESEVGKGTTFTIRLPMDGADGA